MAECVQLLQQFSDFKPKMSAESSMVYEMYQKHGHFAFFGVKYHAELAAIERKWMVMKRAVRGFNNGCLQTLKDNLENNWAAYTVDCARKDITHCRDTCAVYRQLGVEADLTKLEAGQKEYKSHRRVFDCATDMLKAEVAAADMTEKQLKKVSIRGKVRVQQVEKANAIIAFEAEIKAKRARRDHQAKMIKLGRSCISSGTDKRKHNGKGGLNQKRKIDF
jgi:hypothetical protein